MVGRRFAGLIVVVLAVLVASAIAACRTGPKLVDVYYRYYDDQILSAEGSVVGLASGTGRFELYRKGPDTFCAVSPLTGTFTLFGGCGATSSV
jgi:hypothetical protein